MASPVAFSDAVEALLVHRDLKPDAESSGCWTPRPWYTHTHTHTHITQTHSLFILMSSYLWAGEAMPLSSMNRYRHANRLSLCHVCKLVSLSFRHFLGCEQSCCFCSQSVDTQMRLHLLSCVGSCVPPGTASSWTATKESSENQVNI